MGKNFLIVGGNLYNKGAQLMLLSLIEKLKEKFDKPTISVSPVVGTDDDVKNIGVKKLNYPLLHVGNRRFPFYLKFGGIIKLIKTQYKGETSLKDIDCVLDISGFAFGDQWGWMPCRNLDLLISTLKKKYDTKYVLLPQAFGSFNKEHIGEYIKDAVENADLIFPRDEVSYQYLVDICGSQSKIQLAPDITLAFEVEKDEISKEYCCVVPNEKVVKKGDEEWQNKYVSEIKKLIDEVLTTSNIQVKILVHDVENDDRDIAYKLSTLCNNERVNVVEEFDPIVIKKIIANSKFLIGSRFHALASALSSAVPCIGIGWSHKYKMLFKDFGVESYTFDKPTGDILRTLQSLLIEGERLKVSDKINQALKDIKKKSELMWDKILQTVNG